jgi:prepilin-type N-terminal cleavage/methylation domain-containing protein
MDKHAPTRRLANSRGFTLLELMVCTAILLIAALAVSPALVGAQRDWENANNSTLSDLVRDGRAARIVFQRAARRASRQSLTMASNARWIDLPYYDSPDSTRVDRYARLSWSNGRLNLSEGLIDENGARQTLSDTVVCGNVSAGAFRRSGRSAQMKLAFTQGTRQMTIVAAAVINN